MNQEMNKPSAWIWNHLGLIAGVVLCWGALGCQDPQPVTSELPEPSNQQDSVWIKLTEEIAASLNEPGGYIARAVWFAEQGDFQGAMDDLNLALRADSASATAWEYKAELLYNARDFERTMVSLNGCIRNAPESTACRLRRAELNIHLGQVERAFDDLNAALRMDDQLHEAYWMKGKIYESLGNEELARSSYSTAVEVRPDFYDGFIALGLFCASKSEAIAEEYYRSAIELRPLSVEAHYNLAMHYQELGALEDALATYDRILELDPDNATAPFNQGYIYLEYRQDYVKALEAFSSAIERLPNYQQAFFNRGLAHESLDQLEEALSDYDAALAIKPDYTEAALAKSRVLRGQN